MSRKVSVNIVTGQQSRLLNDELDTDDRRRERRWKGHKQACHICHSGTICWALLQPHIVLKQMRAFFLVFTMIPIHRRRNRDSEKLKNMPEVTLVTRERKVIQPPKSVLLSYTLFRRKAYLGMAGRQYVRLGHGLPTKKCEHYQQYTSKGFQEKLCKMDNG